MTSISPIEKVLESRIQAERGRFFQTIFEQIDYLDVDSETLATDVTNQMGFWNDYQTINDKQWRSEVAEQLLDQEASQLVAQYESYTNVRMREVRKILKSVFESHHGLRVSTKGSVLAPEITVFYDQYYQDDYGDTYQSTDSVYSGSQEWNTDYDCSWEDMLSYAEYDG